jgi:DNA-binding CsgD family transcriptional regulator
LVDIGEGNKMSVRDYIEETERVDITLDMICEQMSGSEIAKEIGVSRQAVSNTLKRGLKKLYLTVKKENKTGPFETAVGIAIGLNVDDSEYKKFFKLFPPDIRKEIEADASKRMPKQK